MSTHAMSRHKLELGYTKTTVRVEPITSNKEQKFVRLFMDAYTKAVNVHVAKVRVEAIDGGPEVALTIVLKPGEVGSESQLNVANYFANSSARQRLSDVLQNALSAYFVNEPQVSIETSASSGMSECTSAVSGDVSMVSSLQNILDKERRNAEIISSAKVAGGKRRSKKPRSKRRPQGESATKPRSRATTLSEV